MKGRITQIKQLTHDVRSFHIHVPDRPAYKAGQFLVITGVADGKERKRAYSLASAPHWENVELVVKLNPSGKLTPWLFSLSEGAEVSVQFPYGTFYLADPLPDKIVFLAGGVGVSALLAMMRDLEWRHYKGEVVFLYGNRTPQDIVYFDELKRLHKEAGFTVVNTIDHPEGTDWQGETGFISEELIRKYCDLDSHFYICGPPQMVGHMVQNLEHLSVPHEHIHRELW